MDLPELDAWIDGAVPTTHVVTLYARGELIAELDILDAQIEDAKASGVADRGMDDADPETLALLRAQVLEDWAASAMRLWVRPFTRERSDEMVKQARKEHKLSAADASLVVLAASIVKFQPEGADEPIDTPQGIGRERLQRILDNVGEAQSALISKAYFDGLATAPAPDPTSSPGSSDS